MVAFRECLTEGCIRHACSKGYCKSCYVTVLRGGTPGAHSHARRGVPEGHKRCGKCREIKPHAMFCLRRKGGTVYHSYCKPCQRGVMLKWTYNITPEEYEEMFERQNGCCALCGVEHGTTRETRLAVDHDHKTGAVRGLLCPPCNKGLGHFQDNIDVLEAAIAYLGGGSST